MMEKIVYVEDGLVIECLEKGDTVNFVWLMNVDWISLCVREKVSEKMIDLVIEWVSELLKRLEWIK